MAHGSAAMSARSIRAEEKLARLSKSQIELLALLADRESKLARRIERCARDGMAAPTSGAQQRLWFIDKLEKDSTTSVYNIRLAARLHGRLNVPALRAALDGLVRRHEALRTVFVEHGGKPAQRVLPCARFAVTVIELSVADASCRESQISMHAQEEATTPFDLSRGPLIRGRLLRLAGEEHFLLLTMHHIVSDGWSVGVLIRELRLLYEAYSDGRQDPLPPLPIQYVDYAVWQQHWLESKECARQLDYWTGQLRDAPELLELPTDRPRPMVQSYRGDSVPVVFDAQLTAELKAFCLRLNVTLAMALYTAWSIVLSRLSGQEDVVVGVPIANRPHVELEGLIGLFVNTLAIRMRLDPDSSVIELLLQAKDVMLAAYAHQEAPFEQVVSAVKPARNLSHSAIFQVMFVLQNVQRESMLLPGLTVLEEKPVLDTSKFDLSLSLQESADKLVGVLSFATDLFDRSTIERWTGYLRSVLRAMVRTPNAQIGRLPLMADERRVVIEQFNATRAAYPQGLIHEVFEERVSSRADAPAVIYASQALTFAELNARANQLARHLMSAGIGPDQLVGICVERSVEMLVGILGIWKAGAAYVPLDPEYPTDRLRHILQDAAPRVLLTQARLRDRLPDTAARVVMLDDHWNEIARQAASNPAVRTQGLRSNNLAYVIYTSGSTGLPKGVMVEHRNVLSLWQGLEDIYRQCRPCERIAVNASFNFDASVKQLIQVLSGRTIVIVPQEARWDAAALLAYLEQHGVDGIDCTPWQLKSWVAAGLLEKGLRLCVALVGGEQIDGDLWAALARSRQMDFFNVYGPTESTVDTTFARLNGDTSGPHMGRPMQNRFVYLLDRYGEPVPIGVTGEIYIGGAGIARGYLNRARLTAERFLVDRFAGEAAARMYKTGDLGRWRADGTIEYLGRNDCQVKIRGFRIELEEIEAQLVRNDKVAEAIVIARDDVLAERCLVAYVVARDAANVPSVAELRAQLKSVLPEYMIPGAFVTLDTMPLTPNGKLDRRALPCPQLDAHVSDSFVAPVGTIEQTVAGIWQELLRVPRVGRYDNFFDLGGHSLLATRVVAYVGDALDIDIPLRMIFERPTLHDLSDYISLELNVEECTEASS
jgi:myxalamid-type nonribosomal peptide synthetase MxaA